MSEVLEFKTLVVKVVGLAFSVSSGMALGKEGPLVHVACCWANFCSKLSQRYTENEGKRRELISTAAAAGVAVAFGAPVGGVLFSYEEVSTMFPQRTMIRAFFASVIAALTLLWYNPTGSGRLTMFEAYTPEMPSIAEYPWFILLGAMGGILGSLFVHLNVAISAARRDGGAFRKRVPIVAEVMGIALITAVTSYPSKYTRVLSSTTIRALFHHCVDDFTVRPDMMGLCDGFEPVVANDLMAALALAALVRFCQMTITFGTGVPCGLFVPSLYTGACLGRCLGIFLHRFGGAAIHPGVYAMVGAAAVLGGVCRVTISLVVIMYELTSALQLIVPFMLSVLTAKWVGDCFTHGIYDCYIRLRGYPYLHEPDDFTFGTRACDIMDEDLECVHADAGTVGALMQKLRTSSFGGFPVVRSSTDHTLLGYIHRQQVLEHLERIMGLGAFDEDMPVIFGRKVVQKRGSLDLSKLVDETVLRIVPETPLAQVHNIFRQLGIKVVLVARFAELAGLITKKSFVHHLEAGHIGHITDDPAVQGKTDGADWPEEEEEEAAAADAEGGASPTSPAEMSKRGSHTRAVRFRHTVDEVSPRRVSESRKSSLKMMRDRFIQQFTKSPTLQLNHGDEGDETEGSQRSGKKSLSKWRGYSTVSWRADDMKDFNEHTSIIMKRGSRIQKFGLACVPWLIPALVGILTATSGSLVEVAADHINMLRFGRCTTNWFESRESCGDGWATWSSDADPGSRLMYDLAGYTLVSVVLAATSATLVWAFAPMARGSGIPEVKTILGGFVMSEVLEFKTLVVKVIGLTLSVSSGMSLGKEGPLVHVACCWANFCSRLSTRYVENEAKRRELISTAAAAGVSVAFGTPLGGVLFSYEEVSTMFPQKTMVRAFFAAVVAALCLRWWNPTGTGKLTMFETHFDDMPTLMEYPWFVCLGAIGGVLGAVFVHFNIKISAGRQDGTPFRQNVHIVLEVALIALVTALTSYPLIFTRGLSSITIRSLFQSCSTAPGDMDMMGLCDGGQDIIRSDLIGVLVASSMLRFVQMTFTFGTGVPCGLFVPSLYTGACLGRCVGMLVRIWYDDPTINPGVYAMVGAAAVLGGVCRVTISLVVIMFGLTSALQLIVPFMLAILTAKLVGDMFGDGIYDACIILRGYPYLHEPHDVCFKARACDIMDDQLECLVAQPTTLGEMRQLLRQAVHGGFPLVSSHGDHTLLGYVHTKPLLRHLETAFSEGAHLSDTLPVAFKKYSKTKCPGAMDLSKFVDETVVRIVPETPLAQVHNIFRQLGVKLVLVARFGSLAGMITKKSFVDHLQEGHVGHVARDPAVHRPEARPLGDGTTLTVPLLAK